MKKETTQLGIRCPIELKEKIQLLADEDGRTMSNMIVKILSDYVKDSEN